MLAFPEQLSLSLEMWLAEDCPATPRRDLEGHKLVVETTITEINDVVVGLKALPTEVGSGPHGQISLALRSRGCGAWSMIGALIIGSPT